MTPRATPIALAAAAILAACARDTSLPPPPGPGTIQGRVVYAVPGSSDLARAAGARITILATSLGATADAEGRFVVEGVSQTSGLLLVQADLDADGQADMQRILDLADLHAGPGKDVALGDVAVLENASMRGQVRLAGIPGNAGHSATVIFVPQGPFLTTTADDGSWLLANLPPGPITISYFHQGYVASGVAGVDLRAGERFAVEPATLAVDSAGPGSGAPGHLAGALSFEPPLPAVVGATVTATDLSGTARTAPVAASGSFALDLPAGLYQVEASRTGYVTAVVANVMVTAGQTATLAIRLATGISVPPPPPPPPPSTCISGAACARPNPCDLGAVSCDSGSPVCVSTGSALDGTACGVSAVCQTGRCAPICISGASCQPANPCEAGVVACGSGGPTCTGTGRALATGTACGIDQVCNGGSCSPCKAGVACASPGSCVASVTACATGAQTCEATASPLADGTSCGTDLACQGGVCGACAAGAPCTPAAAPCHAGTTSCATGRPVCADLGAAIADGTACGAGRVCGGGICAPCAAGAACAPQSPCHQGQIACDTGHPVCVDTLASAAPGTPCGAGQVCGPTGACVACVAGQACAVPGDPCHAGAVSCASGAPACAATATPMAPGTACGAGQVCNASGGCIACAAGGACTPANPCHRGELSCATGAPVCGDTLVALANGAACGTDQVCQGGSCQACAVGAACDGAPGHAGAPASPNPCKRLGTLCSSGTPTCGELGNLADNTACPDAVGGTTNVCRAGTCTAPGSAIRLASGGLGSQTPPGGTPLPAGHGWPSGSFTVTVQVVDVLGNPVTSGPVVSATAPAGARVSPATAAASAADGTATFTVTLGRAVGAQSFSFATPTTFSPFALALTADAPPDGTILPVVNASRTSGTGAIGGPASAVNLAYPIGLAAASSGDLYVASTNAHRILRIRPSGATELVAGTGSAGALGDGGLATLAQFYYPCGIALDEVSVPNRLFIADQYTHRVRAVDLSTGVVTTVAGTGTAGFSGDGGPAAAAQLYYPAHVSLGPERPIPSLYIGDTSNNRIRRVDGQTGIITTWLAPSTTCSGPLVAYSLNTASSGAGSVLFDSKGNAFVSGGFCGGDVGASPAAGVARRAPGGALTRVAGTYGGGVAGGVSARNVGFSAPPAMALDRATLPGGAVRENLYLAVPGTSHVLARVDGATLKLDLLAGTPGSAATASSAGDFGSAAAALLYTPLALAFAPGTRDLYVLEENGHAVRMVAGAGAEAASTGSLAAAGPVAQSVYPFQQPAQALSARLADGGGSPLSGYPVEFALDPAGLPGGWISQPVAATQALGAAAVGARPGLPVGRYGVLASYLDLHGDHLAGSPVALSLDVLAPPTGTVITAVNDAHASGGYAGVPGPAWAAQINTTGGVTASTDGTIWFNDYYRLYRIDGVGRITLAGGNGSASASGDGGLATAAGMHPGWVLHDAALGPAGTLLFTDEAGSTMPTIRGVDLQTGIVSTRWSLPATPYGKFFGKPIALGGQILLGVGDGDPAGADFIYQVDLAAGGQTAFLATGASATFPTGPFPGSLSCPATGPAVFGSCGAGSGSVRCSVARSPTGVIYVAATICAGGSNAPAQGLPGILRVEANGTLTRVAGLATAGIATGAQAGQIGLPAIPAIAFDLAGNLWMAWGAGQPLGRVDAPALSTSTFRFMSRSSVDVPAGEVLPLGTDPALHASFASPSDIAFDPSGHLWVADPSYSSFTSNSVRLVW